MRGATAAVLLLAALALLVTGLFHTIGATPSADVQQQLNRLQTANKVLQKLLEAETRKREQLELVNRRLEATSMVGSAPGMGMADTGPTNTALLDLHARWDWASIAREMLHPFGYITKQMLDSGVAECNNNGTMYCLRAQVAQSNTHTAHSNI